MPLLLQRQAEFHPLDHHRHADFFGWMGVFLPWEPLLAAQNAQFHLLHERTRLSQNARLRVWCAWKDVSPEHTYRSSPKQENARRQHTPCEHWTGTLPLLPELLQACFSWCFSHGICVHIGLCCACHWLTSFLVMGKASWCHVITCYYGKGAAQ